MKLDGPLVFDPVKASEMAPRLEQLGFDGAYAFEGRSDPFISIAAAAMTTAKIELMTAIAVAFARNPMSLAYLGNDLQSLSRGRFILGLGAQIKAHIEHRFSMPWGKPAPRMRELVQAIRAIWQSWRAEEKLCFEGEYYHHTLMTPMFAPPQSGLPWPPIYIAGVGPVMTEVAAEVGDGYFLHPLNTEKSFSELSLSAIQRGLNKAGRPRHDFAISAQVITATGLDEQSLQTSLFHARRQIAFYASTPAYRPVLECHGWEGLHLEAHRMAREGKWMEMAGLVDDEILNTFAVVGTPGEVARKIVDRFRGRVERVSPLVYNPDVDLLAAIRREFREAIKNEPGRRDGC